MLGGCSRAARKESGPCVPWVRGSRTGEQREVSRGASERKPWRPGRGTRLRGRRYHFSVKHGDPECGASWIPLLSGSEAVEFANEAGSVPGGPFGEVRDEGIHQL